MNGREIARTRISQALLTTVPIAVRRFLSLKSGDEISWQVKGKNVVVVKAEREADDD